MQMRALHDASGCMHMACMSFFMSLAAHWMANSKWDCQGIRHLNAKTRS